MKNGHLKVHTQSTVTEYSYPPERSIIITCVSLTVSDIGTDCHDTIIED